MSTGTVRLALGSVQFGLAYGITGRGSSVPEDEVRELLALAWRRGIRLIDTAPVYGDIEQRLAGLAQPHDFEYVSKIPSLEAVPPERIESHVLESVARSRARLGEGLRTLLFHRGDDLLESQGENAWRAAEKAIAGTGIRLGGSFYSPAAAARARRAFPLRVAQLPGNALDQRIAGEDLAAAPDDVEIHLRSVFLQGLLLDPPAEVLRRVPNAVAPLNAWKQWCAGRGLTPLAASLGIARGLPRVRCCVIGVDRPAQLLEILDAWAVAMPLAAPALSCEDPDVIDPRRWRAA